MKMVLESILVQDTTDFQELVSMDFQINPMNDRAKGFSIQGKARSALLNYGAYIDWDYNPSGGWNNYSYLPSVAFMAGVPGYLSTSDFVWENCDNSDPVCANLPNGITAWYSFDAYLAWSENIK